MEVDLSEETPVLPLAGDSCPNYEFTRKRLSEIDSFAKLNYENPTSCYQHGIVRFVCPVISAGKTEVSSEQVICDCLILVTALNAARVTWLKTELKECQLSSEKEGITIILPEGTLVEDVKLLIKAITLCQPNDSVHLKRILEHGVGKDLGLCQILTGCKGEETGSRREGYYNRMTTHTYCESADTLGLGNESDGVDRNSCSMCNKSFSQRKLLNRHVRTVHSTTNPNTCQVSMI